MPDRRFEFAACRIQGGTTDADTFVINGDNERVCYVPASRAPFIHSQRTREERWDMAATIARLLNDESQRCREAAKQETATHG